MNLFFVFIVFEKYKKNLLIKKILNQNMESPAFFFTFFLWFLLLSFGPPSKKLRDPFEEHED